jgi:hypothetical protein
VGRQQVREQDAEDHPRSHGGDLRDELSADAPDDRAPQAIGRPGRESLAIRRHPI